MTGTTAADGKERRRWPRSWTRSGASRRQREAIVLREFEGRPYAEIAQMLGISTSALETLLFRARRSLAEELENLVTCEQAEQSVSRALDGRLSRKERSG